MLRVCLFLTVLFLFSTTFTPVLAFGSADASVSPIQPDTEEPPSWIQPDTEEPPPGIQPDTEEPPPGIQPDTEEPPGKKARKDRSSFTFRPSGLIGKLLRFLGLS